MMDRGTWARLVNVAIGIWLMAAPAVLDYVGTGAAKSQRIAGPFIATFAAVGLWECTRNVRRANYLFAGWLLVAPLLITHPTAAWINSIAAGAVALAAALVRGKIENPYGGGWALLFKTDPYGVRDRRAAPESPE